MLSWKKWIIFVWVPIKFFKEFLMQWAPSLTAQCCKKLHLLFLCLKLTSWLCLTLVSILCLWFVSSVHLGSTWSSINSAISSLLFNLFSLNSFSSSSYFSLRTLSYKQTMVNNTINPLWLGTWTNATITRSHLLLESFNCKALSCYYTLRLLSQIC